ncbi:MAG: AarF/ABC1/UbiB kinase family protein [Halobacteriales archaeon]|nr:AarF/ABC1/UbiB kinase family protein [Halobacteriales archaeon]
MGLRAFQRTYTAYRLVVIVVRFMPLAFVLLRDRKRFILFGSPRDVSEEGHERRAEVMLRTFVSLGPTFIKFGQVLSTRPDALPDVYTEVLSQLQDDVPPAEWEGVRRVIAEDIGEPERVFTRFEKEPISGASIGQVHVAERAGEKYAVKVLRPGVRNRIEADLRVIEATLPYALRFAKEGQRFTLSNVADQFREAIREETDYEREARSVMEIRDNLSKEPVIVPEVVGELSSDRVITMEYVEGTKITDVRRLRARGINPTRVVKDLQRAYIQMVLEDGVFHADPHPGNLAVAPDGRVVFYDFGIVGRITDETRNSIFDFYVAVSRNDVDNMINSFIDMGALDPEVDREIARRMFDMMLEGIRGKDIDEQRAEDLFHEVQDEMYEFPLRIPRDLALLVRTSTLLDGVCFTLDEEFDFFPAVREYVVSKRMGPAGEAVLGFAVTVNSAVRNVFSRFPVEVRTIEEEDSQSQSSGFVS